MGGIRIVLSRISLIIICYHQRLRPLIDLDPRFRLARDQRFHLAQTEMNQM